MRTWGSAAAVVAALRDEAAAEIERMERDAGVALAGMRAAFSAAQPPADADPRVTAARRAAAEREADDDWQNVVETSTDRDAWIAAVTVRGRETIVTAPDVEGWTAALAREALAALPGDASVLVVPEALFSTFDARWRAALEQSTHKRVAIESGSIRGGCLARTADGRVTFDNSLEARERRVQAAWRAALAKLYDEAVAHAPAELTAVVQHP